MFGFLALGTPPLTHPTCPCEGVYVSPRHNHGEAIRELEGGVNRMIGQRAVQGIASRDRRRAVSSRPADQHLQQRPLYQQLYEIHIRPQQRICQPALSHHETVSGLFQACQEGSLNVRVYHFGDRDREFLGLMRDSLVALRAFSCSAVGLSPC
jgi:hypothetical protein